MAEIYASAEDLERANEYIGELEVGLERANDYINELAANLDKAWKCIQGLETGHRTLVQFASFEKHTFRERSHQAYTLVRMVARNHCSWLIGTTETCAKCCVYDLCKHHKQRL